MTILATIIAIAAWCGQPVLKHDNFGTTQPFYTANDVDQCREDIAECLAKTPHNPKCFLDEKLGDNK